MRSGKTYSRVGALRAFGNAIVPPVAAMFISATEELVLRTCTGCGAALTPAEFPTDRRNGKPMPRCRSCRSAAQQAWRATKPGYGAQVYAKNKEKTRERHLVRKYGVTLLDYENLLAEQDGRCAICRAPEVEQFKGVLHVDHDHATGEVRGLLCRGCNHMLGSVEDDPAVLERAIRYLRRRDFFS